jgi:lipid A 3-O-deacylase
LVKKILLISAVFLFWIGCDMHHTPSGDLYSGKHDTPGDSIGSFSPKTAQNILVGKSFQGKQEFTPGTGSEQDPYYKDLSLLASKSRFDSLVVVKINRLKNEDTELDLSEPLSMNFLFSGNESPLSKKYIALGRERYLKINFDNDIFDNTDRYYTNGIRIDIISPFLKSMPLNYVMIPYWRAAINYYGICIVQNMYTPSTTKVGGILRGDRPYAASLYLGSYKISNDPIYRYRQTSELDIGIIGPSSLGGVVQKSFHEAVPTNNEPLGWVYQIRNDLILNYTFKAEKGIISGRNFEMNCNGEAALGTQFTHIGGGMTVRAGIFNPYFANLGVQKSSAARKQDLRNFQAYFYTDLATSFIGYDATLEGGMFNHSSVYTLTGKSISRIVAEGCAGIAVVAGGIRLDVGQYILSPEFHGGMWHHWVHAGLTFSL